MMLQFYLLVLSIIISSIYSKCNHYYQSSGPSSTKRPFDICYKSEIDNNLSPTSYRYYCIDSTPADYGNNSVTGYTAFREDFNDINCLGKPNRTRIVNKPFRILCENDNPTYEILYVFDNIQLKIHHHAHIINPFMLKIFKLLLFVKMKVIQVKLHFVIKNLMLVKVVIFGVIHILIIHVRIDVYLKQHINFMVVKVMVVHI
eukprot:358856_1